MNDTPAPGADDDLGNPPPGGNPGDPPEGQEGPPDNPFAELDEATRDWVQTRHEGDVAKLAKQAYELDKFAGSAVQIPGKDATEEDLAKFYSRIGRPEEASKYTFEPPKDMPETLPYNDDLANGFREAAFENGLTTKQASTLHDWFVGTYSDLAKTMEDSVGGNLAKDIENANTALREQWGEPGTETYKANLELAGRFFDAVDTNGGLRDQLSKRGLVGPDGEILVPELAFAFSKAGAAIFTEGTTLQGDGDLGGANPFEGETNLTKIMALVKSDPDKARMLAKAAGKDPAAYGIAA